MEIKTAVRERSEQEKRRGKIKGQGGEKKSCIGRTVGLVWMDNGLIAQCKADHGGSGGGGLTV